jgi:hypothetical protein
VCQGKCGSGQSADVNALSGAHLRLFPKYSNGIVPRFSVALIGCFLPNLQTHQTVPEQVSEVFLKRVHIENEVTHFYRAMFLHSC